MDFCLVHGKSHDHRGVYLIPYNGIINGKEVKNGYFTGKNATIRKNLTVVPDKKQLILNRLNLNHFELGSGSRWDYSYF